MAAITTIDAIRGFAPAPGGMNMVALEFTKTTATDTIEVPSRYGSTVLWCNVCAKATGVNDPSTAISGRVVTLSAGTGSMVGLFLLI